MTLDNEKPDNTGIMSMDDAIRIIQSHERARQGRLRAKQIRELRLNDQRARQRANMGESKMDRSLAATIIQKYYRRHVVRREAKKFRDEEYMFLGMVGSKRERERSFLNKIRFLFRQCPLFIKIH